jgi:hypothetical protein
MRREFSPHIRLLAMTRAKYRCERCKRNPHCARFAKIRSAIRYYPLLSKPCENPSETPQSYPLLSVIFVRRANVRVRRANVRVQIRYYPLSARPCASVPETGCADPLLLLCDRDR